jgi:hypothetical protein
MLEKLTFYLPVRKPDTLTFCGSHREGVENHRVNAPLTVGGVENKKGPARLQSDEAHHGMEVPMAEPTHNPILPHLLSPNGPPILSRFHEKVKRAGPNDCWLWQAMANRGGYGRFKIAAYTSVTAHRLAWVAANMREPGGLIIRHKCVNPPCCNPRHLEIGTAADNAQDKVERGRCRTGRQDGEHNGAALLTTEQVGQIVKALQAGESNLQIARRFPVSDSLVSRIRTGRSWVKEAAAFGWQPRRLITHRGLPPIAQVPA